jgi:6-phosphogluconolactonase
MTRNGSTRREFIKLTGMSTLGLALSDAVTTGASAYRKSQDMNVYIGTYTSGKSEGIYLYRLNITTGELSPVYTAKGIVDPSYIALDHRHRYLYAVNEVNDFGGKKSGAISSFAIDQKTGALKLLNQQPSLGAHPCYLTVSKDNKYLLVANYTGGNVAVFPIRSDGSLGAAVAFEQYHGTGVDPKRQEGPHAHCIVLDNNQRHAYSCDLGTDKVMIYKFDSRTGKLSPNQQPWVALTPGAGPRHLTFHPKGRHAYVVNELNSSVTAFEYNDETGNLKEAQSVPTLPAAHQGPNTCADIHIAPGGRFLYCSNRGNDSIVAYEINETTGILRFIHLEPTQGKTPRNFVIDPTGNFMLVANQNSDNVVTFRLDKQTGAIAPTGHVANVPSPVCLKF